MDNCRHGNRQFRKLLREEYLWCRIKAAQAGREQSSKGRNRTQANRAGNAQVYYGTEQNTSREAGMSEADRITEVEGAERERLYSRMQELFERACSKA